MLIQDDFGLQPLDNGSRMHLMDIIEDQYGKKSTLITSQLPVKDRYDVIGKETPFQNSQRSLNIVNRQ